VAFGLVLSLVCHAALLGWALFSMRTAPPLSPDTPAIAADIITPSEFLRLKQGSEDAKNLETKAKDEPKPDDSKNDTSKPNNAPPPPPPPPQEVAKLEPPPAPEPPKAEEPPKPAPDPIAKKIDEPPPPPPPPEPAPGPTPDDKKLLEQKLEDERKADEAKKAEEEAKKKADEEQKKKVEEEERKKKRAEELKKKKQEEAKKKAEAAKKKFDASKIASLLDKAPDDAPPKALLDRDPKKKGQQAAGSSATATATGKEAGTATGTDTVLSAREQDLLKGMLKSQLNGCWRPPGTGGGSEVPVVALHWEMNPDGSVVGEPRVTSAPSTTAGQVYTEAALRAVKMCAPFRLPPDKYEGGWKIIDWTFDPREML
jgi:colicin import membrane protein